MQVLISRTCDYVSLLGKRNFVNVVMGMGLMMGSLSWIIQVGPVSLHMSYEVEERGRIEMRL